MTGWGFAFVLLNFGSNVPSAFARPALPVAGSAAAHRRQERCLRWVPFQSRPKQSAHGKAATEHVLFPNDDTEFLVVWCMGHGLVLRAARTEAEASPHREEA